MANTNDNYVLAIESAVSGGSIALLKDEHFVSGASEGNSVSRAEDLLPRVIEILDAAGVDRSELSRVAVSLGPGSYTGLRIGLSTVMGLCRGLEIEYVGVALFDAIKSAYDDGPSLIAIPMGKSDICVAEAGSEDARVISLDGLKNAVSERNGIRLLVHSDLVEGLRNSSAAVVDIGTNLAKYIGIASVDRPSSTKLEPFYIQNPRFG